MNLTIISYFVAAAIGFGSAWQIKTWKEAEDENHRLTEARAAEQEVSRMESRRSAAALDAANDARKRESKLRLDAAAAQSAVVSLRDTLHGYVQRANSDPASCPDRAAAVSELLAECSAEYSTLAGRADRHASDAKTLIESWPK